MHVQLDAVRRLFSGQHCPLLTHKQALKACKLGLLQHWHRAMFTYRKVLMPYHLSNTRQAINNAPSHC